VPRVVSGAVARALRREITRVLQLHNSRNTRARCDGLAL